MYLKFVYLVKILNNRLANLSPENHENASNFEGWGMTLVAYIKKCIPKFKSSDKHSTVHGFR